jgi:hypothetical protein
MYTGNRKDWKRSCCGLSECAFLEFTGKAEENWQVLITEVGFRLEINSGSTQYETLPSHWSQSSCHLSPTRYKVYSDYITIIQTCVITVASFNCCISKLWHCSQRCSIHGNTPQFEGDDQFRSEQTRQNQVIRKLNCLL